MTRNTMTINQMRVAVFSLMGLCLLVIVLWDQSTRDSVHNETTELAQNADFGLPDPYIPEGERLESITDLTRWVTVAAR